MNEASYHIRERIDIKKQSPTCFAGAPFTQGGLGASTFKTPHRPLSSFSSIPFRDSEMSAEGVNAKSWAYSVRQYERSRLKNRHKKRRCCENSQHLDLIIAKNKLSLNFQLGYVCFCSVPLQHPVVFILFCGCVLPLARGKCIFVRSRPRGMKGMKRARRGLKR